MFVIHNIRYKHSDYLYLYGFHLFLASLKSFGEKTASLFDRKKKDAETLAAEKAEAAKKLAEEQAQKTAEALDESKREAEEMAASTGKTLMDSLLMSNLINYIL